MRKTQNWEWLFLITVGKQKESTTGSRSLFMLWLETSDYTDNFFGNYNNAHLSKTMFQVTFSSRFRKLSHVSHSQSLPKRRPRTNVSLRTNFQTPICREGSLHSFWSRIPSWGVLTLCGELIVLQLLSERIQNNLGLSPVLLFHFPIKDAHYGNGVIPVQWVLLQLRP